jgi:hypothetical protein
MLVTFKLKSGLDRFLSKPVVQCEIVSEKKVIDVLRQINFPVDMAGIVLVDGRRCTKDSLLRGGELVKVFPPVFN